MIFPFKDDVPTRRTPVVTIAIIVLNAAAFLLVFTQAPPRQEEIVFSYGFIPARLAQLRDGKPLVIDAQAIAREPHQGIEVPVPIRVEFPANRGSIITSLFTSLFMHGGWLHLIGNMWFLWIFGNNVEDRLGRPAFVFFYLAGGVIASLCHWATDPGSTVPVIGASGAVAGVLGAYAVTWPWARVRSLVFLIVFVTIVELPALLVLGLWFLGQLLEVRREIALGVSQGVALWAHIGGFLYGMGVFGWLRPEHHVDVPPETPDDSWAV